jgi:conjugal transfer pilus assembly protein TrbC
VLFRTNVLTFVLLVLLIFSISRGLAASKETEYLIPVPEDCFKVLKIEKNKIYLVKDKLSCTGLTIIKVKLSDDIENVDIYIDNKLWKTHTVKDKTLEQSIGRLNSIKTEPIKLPENKEAEQKAMESYYYTQSEEFQNKIKEYSESIKDLIFSEKENNIMQYYSDAKAQKSVLADDERVYVFISSSMPEDTIRAYAKDLEKLGRHAVLVMRGAIGGLKYIRPTAEWSTRILKKNPYCEGECETFKTKIIIDPFLFRKYSINRVPAVVYTRGIQNIDGSSEGLIKNNSVFWISYGDVALGYHLKVIAEKSQNNNLLKISELLQ